jgi:diguanylate cyclase (GGDEF)-like protein
MLRRVPRRFIALLVLVCVLAGCHHSQERSVSLSDILKADPELRGQRVQTTAIVTYSDPDWRVLFVQDSGLGMYMGLPVGSDPVPGDQVQIHGKISSPGKELENASLTILGRGNTLPAAKRVDDYSALPGELSQLVEVNGIVRGTGMKNGRPSIQLSSAGKPLRVFLREALVEDLPAIGSEIKLTGVAAADVHDFRVLSTVHLCTPSIQYIKVVKSGPADPFALPLRNLSELSKVPADTFVHVTGSLSANEKGHLVTDEKLSLPISFQESEQAPTGIADIAGFWTRSGLEDALARPLGGHLARNGDIVRIAGLKRLSMEAASSRRHVSIRGVVTYSDPAWGLLFVQDDTAATYVDSHKISVRLRPGDVVDVDGVSAPGGFAPIITEPSVGFVRRSHLPDPVRLELLQGNLDAADSKWCSFHGVVHTVRQQDGHTILKLGTGQTELEIQLPMLIHGEKLIDKEVSATGVLGAIFNDRRQAIGRHIFVPSPEFLAVADTNLRQSPPVTIESLQRYNADNDERHSVALKGTATLKRAKNVIFVQDKTGGIEVRGVEPFKVNDGDNVSVRGFLASGEYSPVLEDAVLDVISPGKMPEPETISAKTAFDGIYDSEYVSVRASLAAVRSFASGTTLVLSDKGTFFEALGPASPRLSSLRIGSDIEVRGICRVSVDRKNFVSVNGFSVAFDSPQAVAVLKLGPWWNTQKIEWALLAIAAIATAASLWIVLLRQKVALKTGELQSSIDEKKRAQQFDIARNEVLEAIARNAPPPESMELLAKAVEQQIEGSICAIAMAPDGKSFLNGKPSAVLIAPNFPDVLQQEMLPALSSVLVSSEAEADSVRSGADLVAMLLERTRSAGLAFKDAEVVIAFSGAGELAGLVMVFSKDNQTPDADNASRVLQSASRLVSLARDHWHMHERLVFDARHDALTGLPNRTLAEDRLEQALARAQRRKQLFAVLCIDLDGFKGVNDSLGHHAGDELLRIAATRLRARIRHSDTLARIGGDEFLAVIEDCSSDSAARSVAESVISALQEPITLEGKTVAISGSVGIAVYPTDGKHATELKRNADQAMYRAKAIGRGQLCFWSRDVAMATKVMEKSSSQV